MALLRKPNTGQMHLVRLRWSREGMWPADLQDPSRSVPLQHGVGKQTQPAAPRFRAGPNAVQELLPKGPEIVPGQILHSLFCSADVPNHLRCNLRPLLEEARPRNREQLSHFPQQTQQFDFL